MGRKCRRLKRYKKIYDNIRTNRKKWKPSIQL